MERIETDMLVIGAGSGGLSVAAGAVQMGARVVLLEGHKMGGDCLNYGCVPSKALIAAAQAAWQPRMTTPYGIAPTQPEVDYTAVMEHVAGVIKTIEPHDSVERFEGLGVRVIQAFGHFVSETEVEAGDARISARRIVIATGSRPSVPPIPGLDQVDYLTNETLFDLRERPAHLLIIGGGPIGMEMAQAHRRLGSNVTVIEAGKVLGREDPEFAALVVDAMRQEGVQIAEDAQVASVSSDGGGITVHGIDTHWTGSHLLVATGRTPNTERLNLAAAGIETVGTAVKVNASLRSTNRKVFAIGDVTGGPQFTHVAGYHGGVVIRQALLGLPAKVNTSHIPRVTYTDPEIAQVGLDEGVAKAKYGDKVESIRFDFAQIDRAVAERKTEGGVKVLVHKGRPVGATIAGHDAGEQANFWALVLANRMKMSQISGMISPYPTRLELPKRAAGAYFSPKLFENKTVKNVVGAVQRWLP